MKSAQVRILVLVVAGSLLGALAASRPAAAQCMPDPPTGSSSTSTCGGDDTPTRESAADGATILRLPPRVFVQNPVIAAVSWMVSRSQAKTLRDSVLKPRGFTSTTLRGGRSLKQGRVGAVD